MERARLLQQPEVSQGSSVGARTRTPRVAYEWNAGGRAYLMFSSCLVFGVNVFSACPRAGLTLAGRRLTPSLFQASWPAFSRSPSSPSRSFS